MKEFEIANGDKLEKFHVALLFNKGTSEVPSWVQLCKATENTITLNAESEDYDFIVDKSPTTLIKRYKPSLSNPLTLFKGEEDYNYFWEMFYNLPTGAGSQGEMLIVFMNEKESSHTYKAWKCDVTYILESLDPVNSQLTCTTQINGTIAKGTVTVAEGVPTFTEEETE